MSINFKKQNVDKMLDELFSESTPKRIDIDLIFIASKSMPVALEPDGASYVNKNMLDKNKDTVYNPLAHIAVLNKKGE